MPLDLFRLLWILLGGLGLLDPTLANVLRFLVFAPMVAAVAFFVVTVIDEIKWRAWRIV